MKSKYKVGDIINGFEIISEPCTKNSTIYVEVKSIMGFTKIVNLYHMKRYTHGVLYNKNYVLLPLILRSNYALWKSIKSRTSNTNDVNYHKYGSRGIKMYEKWVNDFEAFDSYIFDNLGYKPTVAHSLDRIDNSGNYEPYNIKWATIHEQNNNKRTNVYIEIEGKKTSLAQLSRLTGIYINTLRKRYIKHGNNLLAVLKGWKVDII